MSAAAAIAQIAPASPSPPPSGGGGNRSDRGFRALLESRMAPAGGTTESGTARTADADAPSAADRAASAQDVAAAGARRPPAPEGEGEAGPSASRTDGGQSRDRAPDGRPVGGPPDGRPAVDAAALAELRARLAAGEDIGAEGLAALLSAAAAERSAVGPAALLAGGGAGAVSAVVDGLPGAAAGHGAAGPWSGADPATPDGLPSDLARALGRGTGIDGAPADDGAPPTDADIAARTTAGDAARAADPSTRGPADGDLPDGAEAALARLADAGRAGASTRAAEVADPNGAALGLRLAGGADGFGQGGFGHGGFGHGGFGQGGFGHGGLAEGGATAGAVPGVAGADRAAPGSFAGLVQVARGGATAQGVIDQVSVAISRAGGGDGADRVTVQLKPASLGSIEVQLEVADDGRVQAHVVADRAETLELLRNDARSLARALADAGLQTDSGSLNFSLKGEQQQTGGGPGGSGGGPGIDGADDIAEAAPVASETWTVADDRLDIRV